MRFVAEGKVGIVVVNVVVSVAVHLALRSQRAHTLTPEAKLRQQLAAGEITEEQYFERESALRSTAPRHRRWGR